MDYCPGLSLHPYFCEKRIRLFTKMNLFEELGTLDTTHQVKITFLMHIYILQNENSSAQFVQLSQNNEDTAQKCANGHNHNNFTAQYNAVLSMSKFTAFQFTSQNSF